MNDQQAERIAGGGRTMHVLAFGDNAAELEMDALDKARSFFGPEMRLEIDRSYGILEHCKTPRCRFYASVFIREAI